MSRRKQPWAWIVVGALLGIPFGYMAATALTWNLVEFGYHKMAPLLALITFLSGPPIGAAVGWFNALQRQRERDSTQKNRGVEVASSIIGWTGIVIA